MPNVLRRRPRAETEPEEQVRSDRWPRQPRPESDPPKQDDEVSDEQPDGDHYEAL